jgi:hypothetical protein
MQINVAQSLPLLNYVDNRQVLRQKYVESEMRFIAAKYKGYLSGAAKITFFLTAVHCRWNYHAAPKRRQLTGRHCVTTQKASATFH